MQQLHQVGYTPDDLRHVVITHRHGDHLGGAMALLLTNRPWVFYGPDDALEGVVELMAATYPEWTCPPTTRFSPVVPSQPYDIAGFTVEFFQVEHRVPTLALRVTRGRHTFAYSADSLPCEALVACARHADLFVCDALSADADGAGRVRRVHRLMHPTAREAAEMAMKAGARALALVHLGRSAEPETMRAEAASIFSGPVTVPDDGARYILK